MVVYSGARDALLNAAPYVTLANTPDEPAVFELEEKKSRFIGHACHVESEEQARAFVAQVRAQEQGARHNVFAFLTCGGAANATAVPVERQSDDGEPQKTAGLPVLEVIRGAGLKDVVVVVTRYFGGTLLGTGGLVRAYTKAAQGALEAAQQVSMISCVDVQAIMPYSLYDTALYTLEKADAKIISTGFTDEVTLFFRMKEGDEQPVLESLGELFGGRGEIVAGEPHLATW